MRNISARAPLPSNTVLKLSQKTQEILGITDLAQQVARAESIFKSSRSTQWFAPVVQQLKSLSGRSEFCMYCSSNEPSHVEHYRPLSSFPDQAMSYDNYLWSCDICNSLHKGRRFPPHTEPGEQILNPIDDDVWQYFFLDATFGRLIKKVDPVTRLPLARAVSTCEVVKVDRQNVQDRRAVRLKYLKSKVVELLNAHSMGSLTKDDLLSEVQVLLDEAWQVDVADYFLKGPGKETEPFAALFKIVEP